MSSAAKVLNIALLGPSGGGKGSHITRLTATHGLRHAGTGDLLRENLQQPTALGILARNYMAQGELVPDELVDAMIEAWGHSLPPGAGIVFDGFPRTPPQARFLDEFLARLGRRLDAVIYLHVPDDEIVGRLAGRLICRACHRPFHRSTHPPRRAGVCDHCGGELYQRSDDTPELTRARLRVFHRTTEPLLAQYAGEGRLLVVPGSGSFAKVEAALLAAIDALAAGTARFTTPDALVALERPPAPPSPPLPERPTALDFVLLGGPGSGKGTQAARLAATLQVPHVATGDLFRDNLQRATALGRVAQVYMARGELVPDDITEAMVEERLDQPDAAAGFILDGFPRTVPQAVALTEMLARQGRRLAGVVCIEVTDAAIIERLSGRLVCRGCQAPYHLVFQPPAVAGRCDRCGGELYQRADDNPETIRARLLTFHRQTEPLIAHFRAAGLLHPIAGEGAVSAVTPRALAACHAAAASAGLACPGAPTKVSHV